MEEKKVQSISEMINGGGEQDIHKHLTVGNLIDMDESELTSFDKARIAKFIGKKSDKDAIVNVIDAPSKEMSLGEVVDLNNILEKIPDVEETGELPVTIPVKNEETNEVKVIDKIETQPEPKYTEEPVAPAPVKEVLETPDITDKLKKFVTMSDDMIKRASDLLPPISDTGGKKIERVIEHVKVLSNDKEADRLKIREFRRKKAKKYSIRLNHSNMDIDLYAMNVRMQKITLLQAEDDLMELYKVMYDRTTTNEKDITSFDDFISRVSVMDLETWMFGLLMASVKDSDKVTFSTKCTNTECSGKNKEDGEPYSFDTSISYQDVMHLEKSTLLETNPVSANGKFTIKIGNKSILIKHINLKDKLVRAEAFKYALEQIDDDKFPRDSYIFGISLFVENILEVLGLDDNNEMVYVVHENIMDIYKALYNMEEEEMVELGKSVERMGSLQSYSFYIDEITCDKCGNKEEKVQVDVKDMLFDYVRKSLI